MFGLTRWSPFEDVFNFQRDVDRLFNQFWTDLPARTANASSSPSFQVHASDDAWRVEIPLPGIDPKNVNLEVANNSVSIRAEQPSEYQGEPPYRYEQSFTVPQFLDLGSISASHRHGMLVLSIPLQERVKPRRIQIEGTVSDQKTLSSAA
jgi:HSP20 family protein